MPPLRLLGLRALRSADGEPPCPADSVRLFTPAVHLPVRPWSPRSRGFPRDADAARTEAQRRPAVTSVAGPRRRRFTKSSLRTSRAGSPGGKPSSGPCRHTLRTNSAAISSAGSSASHFAQPVCMACRTPFWAQGKRDRHEWHKVKAIKLAPPRVASLTTSPPIRIGFGPVEPINN